MVTKAGGSQHNAHGDTSHEALPALVRARRPSLRTALLALVLTVPALAVSGCAAVYDMDGFSSAMTAGNGQAQADAALAALARGDYSRAENHATMALARDAKNPYALLAAGVAYQNTARPDRARQMYEEIVALNSPAVVSGPWWGTAPRLVGDVAAENLRALNDGRAVPLIGLSAAQEPAADLALSEGAAGPAAQRFAVLTRLRDDGLITGEEFARRRAANLGALLPLSEQPPAAGLDRPSPGAEEVVSRLRALRDAFESRNMSAAQHGAERTMILDGLLPADPRTRALPAIPPGGLLEAAGRVGTLQRLREMGLISAGEQARERAAIERATRPASAPAPAAAAPSPRPATKPAAAQTPTPPAMLVPPAGTGNPAAALRSGRGPLEILPTPAPGMEDTQGDGAVLAAAQGGTILQPAPAAAPKKDADKDKDKDKPAADVKDKAPDAGDSAASGTVAVHLASFRTQDRVQSGWAELQARHPALKSLDLSVSQISLPGQGTFYRLLAGPVADRAAAERLCGTLNAQYCKPVFGAN